ncbi:hypothetical protein, partial [Ruminococcus callidus]|uniref:hypothetical protein n=1 Tax=Ruminococcus callidus TaxID=40519 RepID=UPI003FD7C5EB
KECRTKINCDRQYACGISKQSAEKSAEKSDDASYAQALCSVSFEIPFSPASIPHCPTILKISGKFS